MRAFALFEAALRGFWTATVRPTEPVVSVLIDRIATRCGIPDPVRVDAHGVRGFRNAVIHEGAADGPVVLAEAVARLNRYVSRMPKEW